MEDFDRSPEPSTSRGWQALARAAQAQAPPGRRDRRPLYRLQRRGAAHRTNRSASGGVIASLSIPWGFSKGDDDLGGYHLVWPRDLVETAGGFLAAGAHDDARRVLRYLQVTQEADGHWAQNMWLDGSPYWHGIQMDETALPILLVDLAARERRARPGERRRVLADGPASGRVPRRNGPVSPQDRWEEDPGYSPFTLAAEIAALLVAAELADANRRSTAAAAYLRETADAWNASIERWMYVADTDLATAARRRRLLRPRRRAGSRPTRRRRATASCRSRTGRRINRSARSRLDGQPRCARAGALRPARGRRSAHRRTRSR